MKIFRTILLLLAVALLAACHDNVDLKPGGNLPDPNTYISFVTRASVDDDSWMLLPLPGQTTQTVNKGGQIYDVTQHVGVFGYFTDDDASNVIEPSNPVFGEAESDGNGGYTVKSDVLQAYDEHSNYPNPEDGNIGGSGNMTDEEREDAIQKYKNEIFDNQEREFLAAAGETGEDGNIHFYNGAIEQPDGTVIREPGNYTDTPEDPDTTDTPDVTDLPFGTTVAADGTVEMADGTKITPDGTLTRIITYISQSADSPAEGTAGTQTRVEVQIKVNGEYSIISTSVPEDFVKENEEGNQISFPDGTQIEIRSGQTDNDPPFVNITFTMITPDGASVPVDYNCTGQELVFNPGEQATFLNLNEIRNKTSEEDASGNQTTENPVRPKRYGKSLTRNADAIYDDYDDKYYYGYNRQRWMSEDYMFYGYAPASRNAKIELDAAGGIGSFTWEKIPCVSTTDLVVAKEEVWRKNKDAATADVSRIHFDDMQHLMSRIRLYFAVHPDFHKIRRVVVTQASLSFKEEGYRKVYTFKNDRSASTSNVHGKETWTWTADDRYAYNPKYNTAFYSSYKEAHPSDMVVYQDSKGESYGKLLSPLPANGDWHPENLFTDFYIVPYQENKTKEMKLHVKYNIYDTDPEIDGDTKTTEDEFEMAYYQKKHLVRECQRESTITFKGDGLKFQSGVSHALKIMINPDYIYVLGDHDEPADVILK